MNNDKTEKKTIDLTPTWKQQLKVIRLILDAGNEEGKAVAWEELYRMAHVADLFVEGHTPVEQKFLKANDIG